MTKFVGMTQGVHRNTKSPAAKAGEPDRELVSETAVDAHDIEAAVTTGNPEQAEKFEVKEPVEPEGNDSSPTASKSPAAKAGK